MGCVGSRGDVNDRHPNVFRVSHLDEQGADHWSGQLEVTSANLTLYRKRKPTTQWPLQCLRRYGYENDNFIFEAGRRCKTGEGIYSFRCRRADVLFNLLQDYIQESTYNNNNNNMTVNSLDEVQQTQQRMDADVAELRRALISQQQQQQATGGSNYIILHGNGNTGSGGPTQIPQSQSPNRGATATQQSTSTNPCNSPQNAASGATVGAGSSNYLEPIEMSTTSATPTSLATNQSINIYTNVPPPNSPGNVYQQLALAQSSPAASKQENETVENSPAGTPGSVSGRAVLSHSDSLMRLRSESASQATSPVAADAQLNTYMNVTPGEMVLLANSNSSGGSNQNNRFSRLNSSNSTTTAISERCYENLDPATMAQVLTNSASSHVISSARGRHSRPDIFSKVDLPMLDSGSGSTGGLMRMSEPCTPTSAPGRAAVEQRRVNYIVLDLDSGGGGGGGQGVATGPTGGGSASVGNLLSPESPKRGEPLDYATIDFNKTVALSNSTNPSCDSEASRKTRF